MADVPKDPRQLARDILAGKISIEDLAREQAKRRGAPPPPPPPQQQQRVPAPRPAPPPAASVPPAPPPQPQRRVPPQQPTARPQQRKVREKPRDPLVVQQQAASSARRQQQQAAPAPEVASVAAVARPLPAAAALVNRQTLRQAVIAAEILGRPVGLRDDPLF